MPFSSLRFDYFCDFRPKDCVGAPWRKTTVPRGPSRASDVPIRFKIRIPEIL
ncbi:hypothetical protein HanPI659440_Chr02g0035781 [Helianthus annuus]|nr:hypothetical protein HanPI659440_Chr02g0035781 [Helianthus annuus]